MTDTTLNDRPVALRFPTMLRKMWSGGEVQAWLDTLPPLYAVPQPAPDRLTETELADRFRVEVRTVQKWRRMKTGPAYLKAGGVRYLIVDVEAWERSRRVTTKEAA